MSLGYHHVYQRRSLMLGGMMCHNKQYNQHLLFLAFELGKKLEVKLKNLMRVSPILKPRQIVHLS